MIMVINNNIRERINAGEISSFLSPQKFNRHSEGTKEFDEYTKKQELLGRSRPGKLLLTYDEAQDIIKRYAGTGEQRKDKNGSLKDREFITMPYFTGEYEERSIYRPTRRLEIIYSKLNAHMYPVKEK